MASERRRLDGERGDAARQLREVDQRVGKSSRALSETEAALRDEQRQLDELQAHRAQMQQGLAVQRAHLALLLRAAYATGNDTALKLLLDQQRVADANRVLAYHRYLQQAKARQMQAITTQLQELDGVEAEIRQRREALAEMQRQQQQQVAARARDRKARASVANDLERRYQDRVGREKALGQDARALENLLANLRAAAARAEARRRAEAVQRQADARREAGRANSTSRTATKIPPKVVASAPPLKVGGGAWPLTGNLLARYGGRMPDGRSSAGVLIAAPTGSTVTAVADGTVVFSDWMTGYGMILIVDHGNGYMSLYAHNDALLRDAGAKVRRGDAVAKVGNSGGMGTPALYFELRHNGQPVDPSVWLQRR